jgi:hypothetical protein
MDDNILGLGGDEEFGKKDEEMWGEKDNRER